MYKILIVDDNPLIRMGLMNMIQWDRFNARLCGEADNGSKAMEMVEKHQPNLVITDIKMPQKDGLYLLNEISQNYPHISTIVVSAYDEFEYAKQAICSGSLNYILKPIKAKELNDTIKKAYDEFEQQQFNKLDKDTSVLHKNLMNEIASKYASSIVNIATIVFSFHCELS
ncbi:MAG: response regulator, partial [Vallitaleaceae bacterium]|nr:response regulator [Vallitaleaceae bacterium]